MAIKTKQTVSLSRGFLAFVFTFSLSAALTLEAKRPRSGSATKNSQEAKRQATGQQPIKNSRAQSAEEAWVNLGKTFGLTLSDKVFKESFKELKDSEKEDLDSFLSDVIKTTKASKPFKDAVGSILSSIGNGGKSNKILLLETVGIARLIQPQARDANPKESNANKRMEDFFKILQEKVAEAKEADGETVLKLTVTKYNKEHPDKKLSLKDLKKECFGKKG